MINKNNENIRNSLTFNINDTARKSLKEKEASHNKEEPQKENSVIKNGKNKNIIDLDTPIKNKTTYEIIKKKLNVNNNNNNSNYSSNNNVLVKELSMYEVYNLNDIYLTYSLNLLEN